MSKVVNWIMKNEEMSKAMELLALYKQTQTKFLEQKMLKLIKLEYENEMLGKDMIELKIVEKDYEIQRKHMLAKKNNNGFLWITINPACHLKFEDFSKKVDKIVTKTCFDDYIYVYEQRGTLATGDVGKGFHCHILFKRNIKYKPTKCATNVKNSLKGIVGNINNSNQLNIQIIGEDFAKDKVEYILGQNKNGEGKDKKQEGDVHWRKSENIKDFYGNEKILV